MMNPVTQFRFSNYQLPTNDEVIQYVITRTKSGKASLNGVKGSLAKELTEIWNAGDCCPSTHLSIKKKYDLLYKQYRQMMDKKQKSEWRTLGKELFDIICLPQYRIGKTFDEDFYNDQKSRRTLRISSVVSAEYIKQKEEEALKEKKEMARVARQSGSTASTIISSEDLQVNTSEVEPEDQDEYIPSPEHSLGESSQPQTPRHLRSAKKRKSVGDSSCMVNQSTQTQWDSKYDWHIRSVRKKSADKRSAYSKEIEEDILATIVKLIAEADLSTRQAIIAVQVISNNLFGQIFKLPNDMEHRSAGTSVSDYKLRQKPTIDPYRLPTRHSITEARSLMALRAEQQIGMSLLATDDAVQMLDGTTREQIGKVMALPVQVGKMVRVLPLHKVANEKQENLVKLIDYQFERLAVLTKSGKQELWEQIKATMSDLASENEGLAKAVSTHFGLTYVPGQLFCIVHTVLAWDESMKLVIRTIEKQVGYEKVLANTTYLSSDVTSYVAVIEGINAVLKLIGPEHSQKPWNRYFQFSEFVEKNGKSNLAFALKDRRFGRLPACAAVTLYHWNDVQAYLEQMNIRNQLACVVYSFMHNDFFKFFLLPITLIGLHLTEPYLKLVLDKRSTYVVLLDIFPKLYKEMSSAANLSQINNAALPSLADKFSPDVYPKEWINVIKRELSEADLELLNSVCQKMLESCAKAFARQRGGAFEFGEATRHLYPVRDQISDDMLENAPTHNIASERVFGEVDNRLKHAGPYGFGAVSDKIVISHSKDLLFSDSEWKKPELKKMKKETDKLNIIWNLSQKEIRSSTINTTEFDREKIAQDRKLLSLKDNLHSKYGIIPTSFEGIEQIMSKVSSNEKVKVLKILIKIAKNDFKSLKEDHPLFKQRGLNQQSLLSNLKILYGQKSKEVTATVDDIRAVLSGEAHENLDDPMTMKSVLDVGWNEMVASVWDEGWCLGQVISKENGDTYKIKYMIRATKHSNVYWKWPVEDEVQNTKYEQILSVRPIIEVSNVSSTRTIIFELSNHALINNLVED